MKGGALFVWRPKSGADYVHIGLPFGGVAYSPHSPGFLHAASGLGSAAGIIVCDQVYELSEGVGARLKVSTRPFGYVLLIDFVDNAGVSGLSESRTLRLLGVRCDGRNVSLLARAVGSHGDRSIGLRRLRSVATQRNRCFVRHPVSRRPVEACDLSICMRVDATIIHAGRKRIVERARPIFVADLRPGVSGRGTTPARLAAQGGKQDADARQSMLAISPAGLWSNCDWRSWSGHDWFVAPMRKRVDFSYRTDPCSLRISWIGSTSGGPHGNLPLATSRSSRAWRAASSASAACDAASRARRSASTSSRLVVAPAR